MNDIQQSPEQIMLDWLEHPNEFGVKPLHVEIIEHQKIRWPFYKDTQDVFLIEYEMPSRYRGIGIAGPITWSFIGDFQFSRFSNDELIKLYAGWYIVFIVKNKEGYQLTNYKVEETKLISGLAKQKYRDMNIFDRVKIGNDIYYSVTLKKADIQYKLAGTARSYRIYRADDKFMSMPPLYAYLGLVFYEQK